jgi:hypothetical protein
MKLPATDTIQGVASAAALRAEFGRKSADEAQIFYESMSAKKKGKKKLRKKKKSNKPREPREPVEYEVDCAGVECHIHFILHRKPRVDAASGQVWEFCPRCKSLALAATRGARKQEQRAAGRASSLLLKAAEFFEPPAERVKKRGKRKGPKRRPKALRSTYSVMPAPNVMAPRLVKRGA